MTESIFCLEIQWQSF